MGKNSLVKTRAGMQNASHHDMGSYMYPRSFSWQQSLCGVLFGFLSVQHCTKHHLDIFPKILQWRDWQVGCTRVLKAEVSSPHGTASSALFPFQRLQCGCPGNSCLSDPSLSASSCPRSVIWLL